MDIILPSRSHTPDTYTLRKQTRHSFHHLESLRRCRSSSSSRRDRTRRQSYLHHPHPFCHPKRPNLSITVCQSRAQCLLGHETNSLFSFLYLHQHYTEYAVVILQTNFPMKFLSAYRTTPWLPIPGGQSVVVTLYESVFIQEQIVKSESLERLCYA